MATKTPNQVSRSNRPYEAVGNILRLFYDQSDEVLLDGPVGTGKSLGALNKLFYLCEKYPGMRAFIVRKTRKSCTDTLLVTWENEVVPEGHPILEGPQRTNRHSYHFPNKSEVVVLGLDDPTKLMSSQWDFGLVGEALEITKDDREKIATRMRNGVMPYQQVVFDTNPDSPSHWLWKEHLAGRLPRIATVHKDNPRFWDRENNEWTADGRAYLDRIRRTLSGSRFDRLWLGLWSVAEGARFPQLDPNEHLFDIPVMWPQGLPEYYTKLISIDHGFGSPYCALWHAVDFDGNVYTYREDYGSGYTADAQAQRVFQLSPSSEDYYGIYLDPSMEDQDIRARGKTPSEISAANIYRETFAKHGRFGPVILGARGRRETKFATLDKLLNRHDGACYANQGAQCNCEGNGFPNWYIERSCVNLWEELQSAVLKKNEYTGLYEDELDRKCSDHAITSAVYGLHTHLQIPEDLSRPRHSSEELRAMRWAKRETDSEHKFRKKHRRKRRR